ncbi:MAG: hypothetical protein J6N49_00645 [Alphaproteobacteria bacterium]|nr:hypothetical protein [Alphaproteobacteria bacterium]
MAELLDYLGSAEFFGILLLSGGTCFLLLPNFCSWFAGNPRRFWRLQLKYDDADMQSFVRTTWIGGLVLFTIGAVVASVNDPRNSEGIVWILFEMVYLLFSAWLIIKTILLIAITVSSIWNWAVHGKPLFKKEKTQKGDA